MSEIICNAFFPKIFGGAFGGESRGESWAESCGGRESYCESSRESRGRFLKKTNAANPSKFSRESNAANPKKSGCESTTPRPAVFAPKISPKSPANRPQKSQAKSLANIAILSIGGNLKNPLKTFAALIQKLLKNRRLRLISTSPIYKNPPFGFAHQPHFFNATIWLSTTMAFAEFCALVFYLERSFGRGRIRPFKNAPRILDIDIIFFNDLALKRPKMRIPHAAWQGRRSVLIPLFYQAHLKGM